LIVVTTNELERHSVKTYYGLVTGESISGVNLFRDFFASVRDIFGDRVRSYEKELLAAQETALNEMVERARNLGANAILGVNIDHEHIGGRQSMLLVSVYGTAAKIFSA